MAGIVGSRLEWLIEDRRTSQSAVARAIGVKQPSIGRLISGETRETGKLLELARALKTTPEFLVGEIDVDGVGPSLAFAPQLPPEMDPDEVAIDSIDLAYGLGGTFVDNDPDTAEIEKARFSRKWLRKFTHSPPEMLFTTSGIGDSMRPTIDDADIVIVDRSDNLKDSLGEKIWAIVFGGVGMIKRLRPMPDGTVKIMSDNQSVRDDIAHEGELHIVGRVVAKVSRL